MLARPIEPMFMFIACAATLFAVATPAFADSTKMEGEAFCCAQEGKMVVVNDAAASGGAYAAMPWSNSIESGVLTLNQQQPVNRITLHARGSACDGDPYLSLYLYQYHYNWNTTAWEWVRLTVAPATTWLSNEQFASTQHQVSGANTDSPYYFAFVDYPNDMHKPDVCDRNAFVDYLTLSGA